MVQPLEDYPPLCKFTGVKTCTLPVVFIALLLCYALADYVQRPDRYAVPLCLLLLPIMLWVGYY